MGPMRNCAVKKCSRIRSGKSGFSLAEIVVVLVILAVLAAIVVPQFTSAGTPTRQEAVKGQLRTIRAAVELYRAQHQDVPPDLSNGWTPLTSRSDATGRSVGSPLFGPYLPNPPLNPLTHGIKVNPTPEPGVDWWWDNSSGTITALDESGAAFIESP
jgi:general secretion pathway protein G